MDRYVTGAVIRRFREERKMTQSELAGALGISAIELLSGEDVQNQNRSSNMLRCHFYVCPVCGNVIHSMGQAVVICCGIVLPPLEPEKAEDEHVFHMERVEDEWYVTLDHPMTKEHYLSFLAAVSENSLQLVKLYPEGNEEARFKISSVKKLYTYCNRHGFLTVGVSGK